MEENKLAAKNDLAVERAAAKAAEVERMVDLVKGFAEVEIRELAKLLASKSNRELLGATEFLVRDGVHRIGVRLLEVALAERNREICSLPRTGGTKVPA